jgi:hypothetical protein
MPPVDLLFTTRSIGKKKSYKGQLRKRAALQAGMMGLNENAYTRLTPAHDDLLTIKAMQCILFDLLSVRVLTTDKAHQRR